MMGVGDIACERARSRASSALDDELSELDRRALDRHLARCEECRQFAEMVRSLTTTLRNDELMPFTCGRITAARPQFVRGRRIGSLVVALPLVTAGVAAALVLQVNIVEHRAPYSRAATQTVASVAAPQAGPVRPIKLPIGQRLARDEFEPQAVTSRPRHVH